MINLAVVGSRSFNNYNLLRDKLDKLKEKYLINKIISGGAKGADTLAIQYAKENNIRYYTHTADWKSFGKSAGYKRNILIVNDCDYLIAFWDGVSKGTKHSIDIAQTYCKQVNIIYF